MTENIDPMPKPSKRGPLNKGASTDHMTLILVIFDPPPSPHVTLTWQMALPSPNVTVHIEYRE